MNKVFTIDLTSLNVNAYVSRYVARQQGNGMAVFDSVDELLENPNMTTNKVLDVFNKVSPKQVKRFADRKTGVKRLFSLISETPLTKTNWDSGETELYKEKVPTSGPKVSKPRGQFANKKIRCLVDTNPRKEGTRAWNNFQLFLGHGTISYEEFVKLAADHGSNPGGCREDLAHDLKKGRVEIV
tara:strand:+ start:580 stop:1131 length:552 start_codon:yes stop_codon:yes gene_type:complete